MRALAIARLGFTRQMRQRSNVFFMFIFPMALILVLGASFGGSMTAKVGVVGADGGELEAQLVERLENADAYVVVEEDDEDALLEGVERGRLQAGVLFPPGYDDTLQAGDTAEVRFVARADQMQLSAAVQAAVGDQAAVLRAARLAQEETGASPDAAMAAATAAASEIEPIEVRVTTVGEALFPETTGQYDVGASGELILFVFLISMMGGVALIESRRLGVIRRMLATPTSPRDVILGDGLGRFALAITQGLLILFGSRLFFGVDWGDPLGAAMLLCAMGLVGAGAGMLIGSVLRTEQQAIAVSLLLGLGLGALGGSMVPPEIFTDTMRAVSHITPHAWALDGFTELVRHGGSAADVVQPTLVLLAYGAVLLALASWRLHHVMTR